MTNINKLTNAEIERLALLMEECGEVIQLCGKILRHGYQSYNPFDELKTTNRQLLSKEVNDVIVSINLMTVIYNDFNLGSSAVLKDIADKKKKYLHYQDKLGE